jgi:hypothetical protein
MPANPSALPETITIAARFCGPPESGNGGYTCGLLAAGLHGPVEVTLRRPPPLDHPLAVLGSPDGLVLADGMTPIAEARRTRFELEPPPCPGLGAAAEASLRYPGFEEHAFPTCFVCGPGRAAGDGLRMFAGEVAGRLRSEFAWAALDCPWAWAWLAELTNPLVLGRLTVVIDAPVLAERQHIVGGWRLGREGRKYFSGTAIWTADGTICARAHATWIEVDPARFATPG